MGGVFTKCCLDASEDTKNNPVISSAFEVIGSETCSESSTNPSPASAEDLVDVSSPTREKNMMKYKEDAHISCSQQDLRLLMQTMPVDLDTRDTILENLIREEELNLILINEEKDDD
mmetsp:Transcript_31565/g.54913  ORF Transcript_31565/g.54913 Transcript_31565/m.54913 type:complete len:117 (+) Transcript_31565:212-562(+)|eukprot:CAMPEP_0201874572 /NCGR_PEP_ID=MMETSP0902-20130614/6791_1 /ASSEMBLY_ACC=CAM_ASM_000551 /TAXON_ID=420261 /ORGANISM="Thalassiosira antarctica, Strain CCMP982" /LENGTH=116 /DNA_ID=CAMNT_0048401469 /DNA_START=109 /DNA_END=459 /DNA_ORIENTATION=-